MSTAGADPSSAASASSAAAATAAAAAALAVAGASTESVFVKRAGDEDAVFAKVPIFHGDAIADLAERASAKFRWLVGADKIKLFLVPADSEDAVAAGVDGSEGLVLATRPLSSIKALSAVGIRDRCCLLARLPDPPAAAAGECARAARSLPSCSSSRGAGGARGTCERFRRGLRGALTLFRSRFSFSPFAGGGGGGAGGSIDRDILARLTALQESVGDVRQEVAELRRAHDADDDVSFVSPTGKQYEAFVDTKVDDWLRDFCGLSIVMNSRRGLASTDLAAGGLQWDARFSVVCDSSWKAGDRSSFFFVYGGNQYQRPEKLPAPRHLSPTKVAAAEYFAVLEYTRIPGRHEGWRSDTGKTRKALLPRLEQRLAICLQRAGAAGIVASSILDIVAVVGVVGENVCQEAVEAQLSKADCPFANLQAMFTARRFVFFFQCVAAIPVGAPVLAVASLGATD